MKLAELEAAYPDRPVLRLMPNLPVEHGAGVICYAGTGAERELLELLGRAALVLPVDEPDLEPAMAVMSCGPAFLALVVESLAAAGAGHGLDAEHGPADGGRDHGRAPPPGCAPTTTTRRICAGAWPPPAG